MEIREAIKLDGPPLAALPFQWGVPHLHPGMQPSSIGIMPTTSSHVLFSSYHVGFLFPRQISLSWPAGSNISPLTDISHPPDYVKPVVYTS